MEPRIVERFKKRTVVFHWVHTLAFLMLIITGLILFVPWFGEGAAGGATRIIHRVFAVVFVVAPLFYLPLNLKQSIHFFKESFLLGKGDLGWMMAAPDYYFGGPEEKMPPQGHSNTGQKMWGQVCIGTFIVFLITGIILWFFRGDVSPGVFQWAMVFHSIAFFVAFLMLFVHVYLGVIHPRMTESLKSMLDGKVSVHYAKSHYGKWYSEVAEEGEEH